MTAPCKGCPHRRVTDAGSCHSQCEKYKAYRKVVDAKRKVHRGETDYHCYQAALKVKIDKEANRRR